MLMLFITDGNFPCPRMGKKRPKRPTDFSIMYSMHWASSALELVNLASKLHIANHRIPVLKCQLDDVTAKS